MNRSHVEILYQIIAFVFAICVHESAHAWTANQCGDPTARMLGRISLNPIKHVDPIGTVLVPLIGMLSHIGFIGWAKPTPVDPRNFRHEIRDDILTSLAGPASNIMLGIIAVFGLFREIARQCSPPAPRMRARTRASSTDGPACSSVRLLPSVFRLPSSVSV